MELNSVRIREPRRRSDTTSMRVRSKCGQRIAGTAACWLALLCLCLPGAMAKAHSVTSCGSFAVPGATIYVSVRDGHVRCSAAMAIMTQFWAGRGRYHPRMPATASFTSVGRWMCPNVNGGISRCTRDSNVIVGQYAVGKVAPSH